MSVNTTHYNYLIVGQGLAGSLIAWHLIQRNQRVLLIDKQHLGSSSKVAAGIVNPITGHRLNLTNNFAQLWQVAMPCYQQLEQALSIDILSELQQTRKIKNQGQYSYLQKRLQDPVYRDYLELDNSTSHCLTEAEFGFTKIKQSWRVDLDSLLSTMKTWLERQNSYRAMALDYNMLTFNPDSINLDTKQNGQDMITAQAVIFCEGYQAIENPWLQKLPFKLAKGDVVELNSQHDSDCDIKQKLSNDQLLNWGKWLLNVTGADSEKASKYLLGSTYHWNDTSLDKAQSDLDKLLASVQQHTHLPLASLEHEHKVGIRPSTVDRVPFVGAIKSLNNKRPLAYCFNGLGSKGCLIAPYYAQLLADHIIDATPMPEEVSKWL